MEIYASSSCLCFFGQSSTWSNISNFDTLDGACKEPNAGQHKSTGQTTKEKKQKHTICVRLFCVI